MVVKVVTFRNGLYPYNEDSDCIVLRKMEGSPYIDIAFPFHEDTPNFKLTISETMNIRNAIDQLIDIKLLEQPREEK